jgi:hypothetical protein
MKNKILQILFFAVCILSALNSCVDNNINSTFNDVTSFEIDTTGWYKKMSSNTYYKGDTLKANVTLKNAPESGSMKYYWLIYSTTYSQVTTGNKLEWPPVDTLSKKLTLSAPLTKTPGFYYVTLVAENLDTKRKSITTVPITIKNSLESGLFALEEINGNTDVDIFRSERMGMGSPIHLKQYYNTAFGHSMSGKPQYLAASYSLPYLYIFSESEGRRLSSADFSLMADFNQMFYSAPSSIHVEGYLNANNTEFLVNNGKLYSIYTNKANNLKFSSPIAGDYSMAPWMPSQTSDYAYIDGNWVLLQNSHMVVYDQKHQRYLQIPASNPYAAQFSSFKTVSTDAPFDVNNIGKKMVYGEYGFNSSFYSIFENNAGQKSLYLPNFTTIDVGDFSPNSGIISMNQCENIDNAKFYGVCGAGPVLVYATDNDLYAFNYQGDGTSNKLYSLPANLKFTTILLWRPGGHPADSKIIWAGVWDEAAKKGFIYEFEISPSAGILDSSWADMIGLQVDNPTIFDGFGKIKMFQFKM